TSNQHHGYIVGKFHRERVTDNDRGHNLQGIFKKACITAAEDKRQEKHKDISNDQQREHSFKKWPQIESLIDIQQKVFQTVSGHVVCQRRNNQDNKCRTEQLFKPENTLWQA